MPENPKKAAGALKPCLHYAPMNVMQQVARVFELGAHKYGLKNWRKQPVDVSTYYSAALRHLTEYFEHGVDIDAESGQSPLAHVIACCMIVLDGLEQGALIDDRFRSDVLQPDNAGEGGSPRSLDTRDYSKGKTFMETVRDNPLVDLPQVAE